MAVPPLPDEFWNPPDHLREEMQVLARELTERLRIEAEDTPSVTFNTLRDMQIERIVTFYAWIRHTESSGGFRHERNHREALVAWASMAQTLAGDAAKAVSASEIKSAVLEAVAGTINTVLDSMHPDVAEGLRSKFAEAFAESSI